MSDIQYYILNGIFYGYSKESIRAFLTRRWAVDNRRMTPGTPTAMGTPFEGTGMIPSARELELGLEAVTSEVNSRRICSHPFPYDFTAEREFDAFIDNLSPEVLVQYGEVVHYLLENPYEPHLCTNP